MEIIKVINIADEVANYNEGQKAEYCLRYTLTGERRKADRQKGGHDVTTSEGLNLQIKSYHATICNGESLDNIRTEYADADGFVYVEMKTLEAYVMNWTEWLAFVAVFAELDKGSNGKAKMRMNRNRKALRQWAQAHA